jgi:hypothetical protein
MTGLCYRMPQFFTHSWHKNWNIYGTIIDGLIVTETRPVITWYRKQREI